MFKIDLLKKEIRNDNIKNKFINLHNLIVNYKNK